MNARSKRPGSFGAFLLAVHNKTSIDAEIRRARGAGTALIAIDTVLQRLSTEKYWVRNSSEVELTEKGLQYLKKHGLILDSV